MAHNWRQINWECLGNLSHIQRFDRQKITTDYYNTNIVNSFLNPTLTCLRIFKLKCSLSLDYCRPAHSLINYWTRYTRVMEGGNRSCLYIKQASFNVWWTTQSLKLHKLVNLSKTADKPFLLHTSLIFCLALFINTSPQDCQLTLMISCFDCNDGHLKLVFICKRSMVSELPGLSEDFTLQSALVC